LALVNLCTSILVGYAVWRLSERAWLTVVAAAAAPLLPISLHEHAQLIPETLAAPLLLGGAIGASRRGRELISGLLLAVGAVCKVAFVVPALAVALAAAAPRRVLAVTVATAAVLGVVSVVVFGSDVWREVVTAQLHVGRATVHYAGGLLTQAGWNEFALILGGAAAVWFAFQRSSEVRDPALARTVTAAATGGLALALTVFKRGSYISVLVVADPPLLALAACGAAWSWQHRRSVRPAVAVLAALLAGQSLSIFTSPGNPWLAKRPGAKSGLEWTASLATVRQTVALARACPARVPYSGQPYFAFLASRPMPGGQPDLFMLELSPTDHRFAQRAAADRSRCP
jgi:hypothetical protein